MQEVDIGTTSQPTSPTPPHGATIVADSDPIPPGLLGWVMRATRIKRVRHARIVSGVCIGIIVALAVGIVAREYFLSFVTISIPKTVPLIKDIPVIE